MKYRAEIDGLRALSVMAVVIFHFFPDNFKNGFLGVDIFFVISGFLISLQLLNKKEDSVVTTLKQFYARRVKRLLPAVFLFLVFTTLLASFLFLQPDFQSYKLSLFPSMSFWSNIFFWLDSGYFSSNAKLKILLHMWSLSVEEQFYLFYPIFLLICLMIFKKNLLGSFALICLMTSVSLALCIFLYKIGGANPAFFLLPTRIWQFGFGAIIAFYIYKRSVTPSPELSLEAPRNPIKLELLALLSLILFAVAFSGKLGQLQSTIIVTIGAAIFIAFMDETSIFARYGFTLPPFTFLGKISYSLYLYHWPLSVAALYIFVKQVPISISLFGIGLSILLGYLSFRFIENPWRFKRSLPECLGLITACIIACYSIIGVKSYFYNETSADKIAKVAGTHFRCGISEFKTYGASRACHLGGSVNPVADIAILGNSHAQMYAPLIRDIGISKKRSTLLIPLNGCVPTPWINLSQSCAQKAQINLDTLLAEQHIKKVVIGTTWNVKNFNYTEEGYTANALSFAKALERLVKTLEDNGKQALLIGPIIYPGYDISSELARRLKFKQVSREQIMAKFSVPKQSYIDLYASSDQFLRHQLGEHFLEPSNDLCDQDFCYFGREDESYFADSSHLSKLRLESLTSLKAKLEIFLTHNFNLEK